MSEKFSGNSISGGPLISIIVPIYNGQHFINRLITLINNQTYDNIEVVFINDGSTDDSEKVLLSSKGMLRYECIIFSQINSGQGAARNKGLELAKGKYIIFVDQDDIIDKEYVERLYECVSLNDNDIAISGYNIAYNDKRNKRTVTVQDSKWGKFMNITPWGKIYKATFLSENGIRFLEVPLGEDIYLNVKAFSLTEKIGVLRYVGYSWIENRESFSRTAYRDLKDGPNVFPVFNALVSMDNFSKWKNIEEYEYFFIKTAVYHLILVFRTCDRKSFSEYRKEICEWLNTYFPNRHRNKLISFFTPKGENFLVRILICLLVNLKLI